MTIKAGIREDSQDALHAEIVNSPRKEEARSSIKRKENWLLERELYIGCPYDLAEKLGRRRRPRSTKCPPG